MTYEMVTDRRRLTGGRRACRTVTPINCSGQFCSEYLLKTAAGRPALSRSATDADRLSTEQVVSGLVFLTEGAVFVAERKDFGETAVFAALWCI